MKSKILLALVGLFVSVVVQAATVTNFGQTMEVSLMSELNEGSTTVTQDQSVWPNENDRRGLYVITYSVPASGITGAVDLVDWEIPKGTIFVGGAYVEVKTAILPNAGTAAIACGGVTVMTDGNKLETAAVDDLDAFITAPVQTTSDDEPTLTISGTLATQGVFTVYLPVLLGNAQ